MRYPSLWLFLLGMLAGMAAHATPQPPLRLCVEDVDQRPWSTPGGQGLNFELLRRVQSHLGEHFIFQPKPWKRCLSELRLGQIDGVVGAADAVDRRAWSRIPQLPDGREDPARALFADNALVFLRVGGQATWDGQQLVAPDKAVVVQSGYLVAQQLRERGYSPVDSVKSATDALRMLLSGSYDVAVLQGFEASKLVREDARFQGRIALAQPPFSTVQLHLMVSSKTYQRDPQRIESIWQAIGAVRQSKEYRALQAAAGVP